MSALRELLAKFSVDFDAKPLEHADRSINGMIEKLEHVGKVIAGAFVVKELWEFTKGLIEQGDELNTTAERLGMSAQALQQWRFIADQVDVTAEELTGTLKILQKNLVAASSGGEAAAPFAKLHVRIKDAHGQVKSLDAVIPELADKFSQLKNPVEKVALAQQIFGRGGLALIPLLNQGAAGVEELRKKFVELGGGLSEETVQAASAADVALKDLAFASTGLKSRLAVTLLPAVTTVIEKLTQWAVAFQKAVAGTNLLKGALVVLGFAGVAALAPLLLEFAAIAAPIAAAILVVDDLITLFKGGKSEIGLFIDQMFGVGASKAFVEVLTDSWNSLGKAVAFVVDQLTHVSEFGGGVKAIFDDAADFFDHKLHQAGLQDYDGRNAHIRGGADGIGDNVVSQKGRDGGFLGKVVGYNRDAIVGQSQAPAASEQVSSMNMSPGVFASPSSSAMTSHTEVNISVPTAVNAKAPEVAALVAKHVSSALDEHHRKAMASGGD